MNVMSNIMGIVHRQHTLTGLPCLVTETRWTGLVTWLVTELVTGLAKVYWVTGSETWLVTGLAKVY